MTKNPTIIFMGTPEFAVPTLQALHKNFGVHHVVTVPDAVRARGKKILPSAVKQAAIDLGITSIFQPESLREQDFQQQIIALKPDIICVVAFRILPPAVYEAARLGSFNIHGSLLPKYRGAAPIQWAIINGEKESGVSSFLLERKVDTGNIVGVKKFMIPDGFTSGDLYEALMPLSSELAVETCTELLNGTVAAIPQEDSKATKAPKIFRENANVDWSKPALEVRNFIHGYSPVPTAWTNFQHDGKEEILKIYHTQIVEESFMEGTYIEGNAAKDSSMEVGSWKITDTSFVVHCADGLLELVEIQLPNKKRVSVQDFCNGWRGERTGKFT